MEIIKHNGNTEGAGGALDAALAERRKEYVGQWLNASFELWLDAVLSDNKLSERSLRIYRRTYERWAAFCEADPDIESPKMLTLENIDRFHQRADLRPANEILHALSHGADAKLGQRSAAWL